MDNHLVVFAREPRYGNVKKRLARDIGKAKTLHFYRSQLQYLLRRLGNEKWIIWFCITPDTAVKLMARYSYNRYIYHKNLHIIPQGNGGIGDRMLRFLGDEILPPGRVVIIGSDIPTIQKSHINKAFKSLGNNDCVFGKSIDGGYWLVGLKRLLPLPSSFMKNIRFSSLHALQDSINSLPKYYKIKILDQLEDIDDGKSYEEWLRLNKSKNIINL